MTAFLELNPKRIRGNTLVLDKEMEMVERRAGVQARAAKESI